MIQMSQLADMHFKQLLLPLSDIRKNAFMINIKSRYQQKNISYNERKKCEAESDNICNIF